MTQELKTSKVNLQERDVSLNIFKSTIPYFFLLFSHISNHFFILQPPTALQPSTAPAAAVQQPKVTVEKMPFLATPHYIAAFLQSQSPPHLARKLTAAIGSPQPDVVSILIKCPLHILCY